MKVTSVHPMIMLDIFQIVVTFYKVAKVVYGNQSGDHCNRS